MFCSWIDWVLVLLAICLHFDSTAAKYIERGTVYKSGIWLPPIPEGQSLIESVISPAGFFFWAIDFRATTVYSIPDGPNPQVIIQLEGVYNLTQIQILGPKSGKGINNPFHVDVNEYYITPCEYPESMHWTRCKTNLKFMKPYELLNISCAGLTKHTRYVRFSAGRPGSNQTVPGLHFAELYFYGQKIAENTLSPEPGDEPGVVNHFHDRRYEIFNGVTSLRYEATLTEFHRNYADGDIPLYWGAGGIMALSATRGNGSVVGIVGQQWLLDMQPNSTLAENLLRHLGKSKDATFVNADEDFRPGDVIVVNRNLTFDVDRVKEAVMSGNNGLLLSFMGRYPERYSDSAGKLVRALDIRMNPHPYAWGLRDVNPESGINSTAYMPLTYHMDLVSRSWTMMRTFEIPRDFNVLSSADLVQFRDEEFQTKLRKVINKYERYFGERFPCEKHPASVTEVGMKAWWNFNQYMLIQFSDSAIPLPGSHIFPGLVGPNEKPVTHRVSISTSFGVDYVATGVYANPGRPFKMRVLAHSHSLNRYRLTFGCHADRLNHNKLFRFPRQWQSIEMQQEATFIPPFGGLLLLMTHAGGQNITLEFEDVYRHPWFDIRNRSSVDDWENERKRYNGVPWMMYMGDAIQMCVPTKHVVKLNKEDILFSVSYLDNTVKIMHNFRGSKYENDRLQVFVCDVQISAGWGHSGYPIMGYLPWHEEFTNIESLKRHSAMGMTHEIGHNLQVWQMTLKYGTEVTNNIYHFPVRGRLLNLTVYGYDIDRGLTRGEIDLIHKAWIGSEYNGVQLGYYNWLGFIFGEGLLSNLMASAFAQGGQLNSEEKKVNFWLINLCNETQYNVLPWQELWHFPITNETRTFCGQFKCFFPDDERITRPMNDLVNSQLVKYGGICDRTTTRQVKIKRDLNRGFWSNREPSITLL